MRYKKTIGDLPEVLKGLAIERRLKEHPEEKDKDFSDMLIGEAFQWDNTNEGWEFWSKVSLGEYNELGINPERKKIKIKLKF